MVNMLLDKQKMIIHRFIKEFQKNDRYTMKEDYVFTNTTMCYSHLYDLKIKNGSNEQAVFSLWFDTKFDKTSITNAQLNIYYEIFIYSENQIQVIYYQLINLLDYIVMKNHWLKRNFFTQSTLDMSSIKLKSMWNFKIYHVKILRNDEYELTSDNYEETSDDNYKLTDTDIQKVIFSETQLEYNRDFISFRRTWKNSFLSFFHIFWCC